MTVTTTVLLGEQQTELGSVALERVGEATGVGISPGRLPKRYWHLDPNEDAVAAAAVGDRRLLAVADGHNGREASHAAIRAVAALAAAQLATAPPPALLARAIDAARAAVTAAVADAPAPRDASRTALSIAVVGGGRVRAATWGDTAAVRVRSGGRRPVRLLGRAGPFLGPEGGAPATGSLRVRRGDRVVVCSDGITDHLGRRWQAQVATSAAAHADDVDLAADLVRRACDAGAGDHVSVATTTVR